MTHDDKANCCEIHGDVIVHESGGVGKPTIFGRDYCPTCQAKFVAAMDDHTTERRQA